MKRNKYICIHGHFYQPPRENPWLESIEIQDSAFPFHDWNERITAECYEPNTASPILDGNGAVLGIMNNLSKMSFNFGPTLLSWLQKNKPEVYKAVIESDKISQKLYSGHGSALAQCYNHIIMPLANKRDKVTQVRWGIFDFFSHFGRRPEGMWLPETAVDTETLEILVDHGIRFTLLSPYQAKSVRKLKLGGDWHDVSGGKISSLRPYVKRLPSGRQIILYFYNGTVSQAVAFEHLLSNGDGFAARIASAFTGSNHFELAHIATDGETYGHHHKYGDMALAYALYSIESKNIAKLTNYSEFLDLCPPTDEVEIIEDSAWSCSHGVGRWSLNCGCNSGSKPGEWNQEWRAPLREAFDWLRDSIAGPYEAAMEKMSLPAWEARDNFIQIINDRSPERVDEFLRGLDFTHTSRAEQVPILKLLEMQRNALLMYTSCGWFFDEISGIETVQCIEYAARAIELASDALDHHLENEFLNRLEKAKSNIPELENGKIIYNKLVKPSMMSLEKIGAHYAALAITDENKMPGSIYCYDIIDKDIQKSESGKARFLAGRAVISSQLTLESEEMAFGVIHLGDHNFFIGVKPMKEGDEYNTFAWLAKEAFSRVDFPAVIHVIDRTFEQGLYSLKNLFKDTQRMVLQRVLGSTLESLEGTFRKLHQDYFPLMQFLEDLRSPLPIVLEAVTTFIHRLDFEQAFHQQKPDLQKMEDQLLEAKKWDLEIDILRVHSVYETLLSNAVIDLKPNPADLDKVTYVLDIASSIKRLELNVSLWKAQREFYYLAQQLGNNEAVLNSLRPIGQLLKVRLPDEK